MANFNEAYGITNKNEGGYAFNPNDHGGETYAGIARKFWGDWSGWRIIDSFKESSGLNGINAAMKANANMQLLVEAFYKSNFWNPLKLDAINDQQIANAVYDFAVNSGTTKSAKTLQQAVAKGGVTLAIDGVIGAETIGHVNDAPPDAILGAFNDIRRSFYEQLATNPGQEQFLHSWLSRIIPYQA